MRNDKIIEDIYNFTMYFFHTFNGVPNPNMKVMLAIGYNNSNVAYLRNRYKLFINMNALISEYSYIEDDTRYVLLTKTFAMHLILHELSHVEQSFKQSIKQRESAANLKVADFMIKNYDKVSEITNFESDKQYWLELRNNILRGSLDDSELEYVRVQIDELLPILPLMEHPIANRLIIESEAGYLMSVSVVNSITNERFVLTPNMYKGAEIINKLMYENKLSVSISHDYRGNYLIGLNIVDSKIIPVFRDEIGKYNESQIKEMTSM